MQVRLIGGMLLAATGMTAVAQAQSPAPSLRSDIVQSDGAKIGELALTAGPTGVYIRLSARNLTPGWHAMHFHATADCSDAGFQKSGGHINHADHKASHGLLNPKGPDFGDLPNIHVGDDGQVHAEAFSSLVALQPDATRANLFDGDGSALVIHAGPDDHISQPIGGAGARVACAAIKGPV